MMVGLRWLARGDDDAVRSRPRRRRARERVRLPAVLPLALPVTHARPADWLLLAYLGVFQIGVAYALLLSALRHVAALEASLLLFVEPVLSPIWAWLFHGERPGGWTLAGGAVILATTAVRGWLERAGPLRVTPAAGVTARAARARVRPEALRREPPAARPCCARRPGSSAPTPSSGRGRRPRPGP